MSRGVKLSDGIRRVSECCGATFHSESNGAWEGSTVMLVCDECGDTCNMVTLEVYDEQQRGDGS